MFIDRVLQKINPSSKSTALLSEIKKFKSDLILSVFRFINAKDTFEQFFTKHLCNRLIQKRSESTDAEREFISILKYECGNLFTSRVEQMFVDMNNSEELMKSYKDTIKTKNQIYEIEYFVLSSNSWPITATQKVIKIPKEITDGTKMFVEFYRKTFEQKRKLEWSLEHCSCLIKGNFYKDSF